MESTACPLNLTLKVEEEEEEIRSRDLEDGPTDMQKVRISDGGWVPALFDEVAIYFSDEEWEVLTEQQKALYREVMRMNYETVLSLEFPFPKPDMISRLEGEEEPQNSDGWQLPGGTFAENEEPDVKPPDWVGPMHSASPCPQPQPLDGFGLRLPRDIAELPEWSEGYPFYMAMGFPGYELAADDLAAKFQFSRGMRRSYDAGFKLMVVEYAESTNNCQAAKQFGVLEKNVRDWRKVKPQLQNAHAMRRAFRGPKNGRFALVDQRVAEYVRYMQAKGDPITREAMQLKALEIAQEMNIPEKGFKASLGWCRRMMRRYDLSLRHKVPVPQQLPEDLTEKLVTYQRSVLALRRAHDYQVAQMGNADETPICLEVPSRVTVDNQGEKPVLVKTPGREKLKITAMLGVLADGRKLPPLHHFKGHVHPPREVPQRDGNPLSPLRLDDRGLDAGLAGSGVETQDGRGAQAARDADPQQLPGPRHRLGEELHGEHEYRHGHHPRGPDLAAAGVGCGGLQAAERQRARPVLQLASGGEPGAQPHRQCQETAPRPLPGVGHGRLE